MEVRARTVTFGWGPVQKARRTADAIGESRLFAVVLRCGRTRALSCAVQNERTSQIFARAARPMLTQVASIDRMEETRRDRLV